MTGMSVIHAIRCVREEGASVAAIARELGISELAVHKYLREVDLSGRPPVRRERPSRIDRWVPLVGGWLAEDRRTWSKHVLLQCLFSRLISIFPQCGRMVFPGLVIMQSVM
ncbi:hypothetical protein [Bifidobacterium pseudolongum]|uniref:hypothetical protein n=1 Tax=Bifidobacterium pseudolongum TaxID=1694 RepID=UPI001020378F|nr:hypothetical protein [Bifidobacterium pseudolongum]